jgi:GAF domain-containing protein/anti-sigma regulatory factor (Ser/Thr protein kinase)
MGRRAKSPKGKAEPKRSPVRKPPKNDGARVRDLESRLAEALEQQTATSEILRVISSSPTDLQPVFDIIAESAAKLCGAEVSIVTRFDGEWVDVRAAYGTSKAGLDAIRGVYPMRPSGAATGARAVRDCAVAHIPDVLADPEYVVRDAALTSGFRAALGVPMVREGRAIGSIAVGRAEPGAFSERQIRLLGTFADQAVIAIENVRLFNELQGKNAALTQAHAEVSEALERQTATADILRVISSSPTDVQPVLDVMAESAARLCEAAEASIFRVEGDRIRLVAQRGTMPHGPIGEWTLPLVREGVAGRSVIDARTVHLADVTAEAEEFPVTIPNARRVGFRSMLSVPLVRDGVGIGAIQVFRREARLFSERQVALLETFADQAVIAIENVRLFMELQTSNRDLTQALDQQTATSEILRSIAHAQTDAQPVFDAIVDSAMRLLRAESGAMYRLSGDMVHLVAFTSTSKAGDAAFRQIFPRPLAEAAFQAETVRERAPCVIEDIETDRRANEQARRVFHARGYRSIVYMPMFKDGAPVGNISVARREPGTFTEDELRLLQTFADQAVIAIENVRLFKELEARNRDLTESLEQQTATSEILRVISSSPTDVQPVFDAIVRSASRLCGGEWAIVTRYDGERLHLEAQHNPRSGSADAASRLFPHVPHYERSITARALVDSTVVHVSDVETEDLDPSTRELYRRIRLRAVVAVPMIHEGRPIGVMSVSRETPGPFSERQIDLLRAFADQAVIAIENVRLFKELQSRTGELTQSVEQLTALSEVSRAVTSTLDVETVLETVVSRARQLAGADGCLIYEYDEGSQQFHSRATNNLDPVYAEALRGVPIRKGEGVSGRAAEVREAVQVADMTQPFTYQSSVRDITIRAGYRAVLSVPLLREDEIIGSLILIRKTPGEFSPEIVEALKTFATQSALAIQNARLFREIEDKGRQLEVASQHKSEFLANMSHELRTPLNAIIGFSEVLNERMFGELNEKQSEYLKDIYASGQHLLSLINDILDLSKIEAGRMELEAADFDLPSAIDNALILVRERATRRGITLGRTVDDRLGIVRGDERKVKQVLLNLLSNALKFTPEGGRIDVSAHLQDGAAEIAVADMGVGIAPEDQEAIFEEFRQVGTADKKVEGTGLGLALSRKFIELHGGRIWVKSEVGKGSTFTFTLPVRHGK